MSDKKDKRRHKDKRHRKDKRQKKHEAEDKVTPPPGRRSADEPLLLNERPAPASAARYWWLIFLVLLSAGLIKALATTLAPPIEVPAASWLARKTLRDNHLIRAGDLQLGEAEEDEVATPLAELEGKYLRAGVAANQPLTRNDVSTAPDLAPDAGMRTITHHLTGGALALGVSLNAGTWVDVCATEQVDGDNEDEDGDEGDAEGEGKEIVEVTCHTVEVVAVIAVGDEDDYWLALSVPEGSVEALVDALAQTHVSIRVAREPA